MNLADWWLRLPAVRAALREQRRRTTFGTRTAALLNVEVSEQPLASSKRRVAIDVLVVGSCVVMCGHSVALALLQSTPPKGLLHYALPVQMWASAAIWGYKRISGQFTLLVLPGSFRKDGERKERRSRLYCSGMAAALSVVPRVALS